MPTAVTMYGMPRIHRSRTALTILLACVLAFAGLTGCAYVTAPAVVVPGATCLPHAPRTAADLQAVFNTRGPRWAGADGGYQALLPDGRILWSFGDTFVSQVTPTGKLINYETPGMISNSFIIQSGSCFTHLMGGVSGHPNSVFNPPNPNTMYWPLGGYYDPYRNQVVVDSMEVIKWTFNISAMSELYFSWPGLKPVGSARFSFPTTTGWPKYGESTLVDSGQVYLYTHVGNKQYVARKPLGQDIAYPLQYWTGETWSTKFNDVRPMVITGPSPLAPLNVIKYKGRYVASAKLWDVASNDVSQWAGPSPTGPWTYSGRLTTTPGPGQMSYGGHIVMLPGNVPAVSYSVNSTLPEPTRNNVLLYGIRIVPYVDPTPASAAVIPTASGTLVPDTSQVISGHFAHPR